jgi:hypothetical protein
LFMTSADPSPDIKNGSRPCRLLFLRVATQGRTRKPLPLCPQYLDRSGVCADRSSVKEAKQITTNDAFDKGYNSGVSRL